MSTSLSLLFLGATTTISLVAAIGAQGTYVLRQGILGRHITPIIIFCILSDALMIGLWYYLGCCCGSLIWFLMLGYGSRLLRPLFARPSAWRFLDGATALLMAYLVFNLLTLNLSTH